MHQGNTLRMLRLEKEWTQEKLAKKVGRKRSRISQAEAKPYIHSELLVKAAKALEVSPCVFFVEGLAIAERLTLAELIEQILDLSHRLDQLAREIGKLQGG